jgi:hypothetical protein
MADFGRPGWSEVASIAALAVRLRIGSAGAPPRYAAYSETVRLTVLAGMLVNAAGSTIGLTVTLWLAGWIPLVPAPPVLSSSPGDPEWWPQILLFVSLAGLLWLPAFLSLVWGRWAASMWLGTAAVMAAVLTTVVTVAVTNERILGQVSYPLLINALLLLALPAFRRRAAPVERRHWLAALGACVAVIAVHALLMSKPTGDLPPLDWAGLWCAVLMIAVTVHLAGRALKRQGRFSAWTPALAILAFTVLGLRLVTLLDYARFGSHGWHPATVPLAIAETAAVGAVSIVLAVLSTRALRRLPSTAADATAWSTSTKGLP